MRAAGGFERSPSSPWREVSCTRTLIKDSRDDKTERPGSRPPKTALHHPVSATVFFALSEIKRQ
eukprot:220092-Rhodomonas_salina.5